MAKKRSCRRTVDESVLHEKAVKIRKKTDEQLIFYIEDRVEKARSEGYNEAKKEHKSSNRKNDIESIVNKIGEIKGIGSTKLSAIRNILEEELNNEN